MKKTKLQAHRGVSCEYPENTMPAFQASVIQGYDVIELDPAVTRDCKIVVLHDSLINRTARLSDGSPVHDKICISDITYEEALKYDFGLYLSQKFGNTKIPLLSDVLKLAAENNIRIKIDNKIQSFTAGSLEKLFSLLDGSTAEITCSSIEFAKKVIDRFPKMHVHYDGEVNEEALKQLSEFVPKSSLTVWLPFKCKTTEWVKVPFCNDELSHMIKQYAHLGIWLITSEKDYESALTFNPDIIETDGRIKPVMNENFTADCHTHSESSHDSVCPVESMCRSATQKGLNAVAVTDHADMHMSKEINVSDVIKKSTEDAKKASAKFCGSLTVLAGVEIGEGFWFPDEAKKVLSISDYDIIVGSVHIVRFGEKIAYSAMDFSKMTENEIYIFLGCYFNDILEMLKFTPCDVMAHLTCPLRYIVGKYHREISLERFMPKIKEILSYIIKHAIALEINTSCIGSDYNELLPNEDIIKMYKDMGGYLITLASDAHIAENAGNNFEYAIRVLKKYGFENCYYYKNRYAVACHIGGKSNGA